MEVTDSLGQLKVLGLRQQAEREHLRKPPEGAVLSDGLEVEVPIVY